MDVGHRGSTPRVTSLLRMFPRDLFKASNPHRLDLHVLIHEVIIGEGTRVDVKFVTVTKSNEDYD